MKIPRVWFMTTPGRMSALSLPIIHYCHIDLTESHLIFKHFILNPTIFKHAICCIDTTNLPNNLYFDTSLHQAINNTQ